MASGGTGSGIVMNYSQLTITGQYLGGDGSHIEGMVIGGGLASDVVCDSVGYLMIRRNQIYGPTRASS
jgi:hypothetical protein